MEKYKLQQYIRLQHELVHAMYDETDGKWRLKLRKPIEGSSEENPQYEIIDDEADLVIGSMGLLTKVAWPKVEGLEDFKGTLIHSGNWPMNGCKTWQETVKDWGDKNVGVIGSVSSLLVRSRFPYLLKQTIVQGSSAIQIVPALHPFVKSMKNYVRNQTWISMPYGSDTIAELMKRDPEIEGNCSCIKFIPSSAI